MGIFIANFYIRQRRKNSCSASVRFGRANTVISRLENDGISSSLILNTLHEEEDAVLLLKTDFGSVWTSGRKG